MDPANRRRLPEEVPLVTIRRKALPALALAASLAASLVAPAAPAEPCVVLRPFLPDAVLRFHINPGFPADVSGTPEEQVAIVLCAARAWREQTRADLEIAFQGTTDVRNLDDSDGVNSFFYTPDDGGDALAVTLMNLRVDELDSFDIVLFGSSNGVPVLWRGPGHPRDGEWDLRGIATHELGHVAGLGHDDDPESVMFPVAVRQGLFQRRLTENNRRCIDARYGIRGDSPPALVVSDISPAEGPAAGGNSLVIRGGHFILREDTEVLIDGFSLPERLLLVPNCETLQVLEMPSRAPGIVDIRVSNGLGTAVHRAAYEYVGDLPAFRRGNVNADAAIDLTDGIFLLA
ncbi:MAG: matrixin family metalloprotease, partial [Planctomycetota bacterium]|nr:matrixin family metalloprotease [Planctomycetota bacterium]